MLARAAVELALAEGGIEYAEVAQAQVAAEPAEGQVAGGFGVAFQGEVIGIAITERATGHAWAVAEIPQGVVTAQGTGGQRKIRQALLQQGAGDVERYRGRHLAAQGIGGDHHGLAGTVDEWDVGQGVGAGLQSRAVGFVAVDKQVHRRGHRRLTGKLRQGVRDQVGAHGKIPGQLHPAQAHRATPGQRATDHVAGLVGQQALIVGKTPGGVVTSVTIVEGAAADSIGQGLAQLPGVGQGAPGVEQPHFVPRREVTAAVVGVIEIHVIVEQGAEAAHGLGTRIGIAVADELFLQPGRRHIQQQALAVAVVVAVQARHLVQGHTADGLTGQFHAHVLQRAGRHKQLAGALLDRDDAAGVHLVDHQFQKQLCIGNCLHAAGRRRQVARHRCAPQPACHCHRRP